MRGDARLINNEYREYIVELCFCRGIVRILGRRRFECMTNRQKRTKKWLRAVARAFKRARSLVRKGGCSSEDFEDIRERARLSSRPDKPSDAVRYY